MAFAEGKKATCQLNAKHETILLGPSYITATIKERSTVPHTYKTFLYLELKGEEELYLLRKFQTIVPKEERSL